jgi:uncharacterized membrane protein
METLLNPNVFGLFICGILFVAAGFYMKKKPPKDINALYGYRTASSMKSQERWDFAQIYGAGQLLKTGALLCLLGLLGFLLLYNFPLNMPVSLIIFVVVLMTVSIIMILTVEKAIKRKFG